jgi:two-component sensor histidine kinase
LLATVALARDEILAPWRRSVLESFILLAVSGLVMGVLAAIASRFADQDYRARLELEETARALTSALGEKELLLKEIHHRVKNNLQITSNLIRLQSRQFKDPEVLDAFQQTQQRLRSISLVHDVLYHENTSAVVDLLVYLTELTREIATANGAEARGVAVTIESDPVVVSPSQVTPLGLCLGEVLTNAFKHAFPEGSPSGLIAVTGRASGEEIEVTVRDNGRGFDPEQTRKGSLGLMLITVLTQQLRGRFSFSNEGGTVFRLSFPKA